MSAGERLPLIGRDRVLVGKLAKALHNTARGVAEYSPLRETPRGNAFEVRLVDGYVVKVTVELDRLDSER